MCLMSAVIFLNKYIKNKITFMVYAAGISWRTANWWVDMEFPFIGELYCGDKIK